MFKQLIAVLCSATCLLASSEASATLVDRGGGLLYDSVLNVTWLQDANYAKTSGYDADGKMTANDAATWAASLVFHDSVRNVNLSDWRLARNDPSGHPFHYGWWFATGDPNPTQGPHSELSHMYYVNLGLNGYHNNVSWPNVGIFGNGTSGGENNVGLVTHLQGGEYWSDSNPEPYPFNRPWTFSTDSGDHYIRDNESFFAWAVMDGDAAAIPEPGTLALMVLGIAGIGIGRRGRNCSDEPQQ